jgi:hypothetical protein
MEIPLKRRFGYESFSIMIFLMMNALKYVIEKINVDALEGCAFFGRVDELLETHTRIFEPWYRLMIEALIRNDPIRMDIDTWTTMYIGLCNTIEKRFGSQ